jgi:hypothetical protein
VGLSGKLRHDFWRTAVRSMERAAVPRSVAMKITGHKTESVYRRYAIVDAAASDEGLAELATLHQADVQVSSQVVPFDGTSGARAGSLSERCRLSGGAMKPIA